MKRFIYFVLLALALTSAPTFAGPVVTIPGFGQSAKVKAKDLQVLAGAPWTGNLIYLDYKTEKKVSLPCNLTVTQAKGDKSSWVFACQYPNEPKADSTHTVAISKDGRLFDGETVIESTTLPTKTLKIVTQKGGYDNYKKALFRFTYLLSKTNFSIKKEVQYEGTTKFFMRNEYNWKR